MCSSTRGPAIWPSLVTWPTSMRTNRDFGEPDQLLRRGAHLAHRAGRASSVSRYMVWIESIHDQRRSGPRARVETMSRTRGGAAAAPARRRSPAARAQPHLVDRFLARDIDARWPARAISAAACSSSVDLPMPGSPPTSSAEPGTSPPPHTRSSSAMPVRCARRRLGARALSARRRRAPPLGAAAQALGRAGGGLLDDGIPAAAGVALAGPFRGAPRRIAGRRKDSGWFSRGPSLAQISRLLTARGPPSGSGPSARPWMNWST
jgi:hypothetical protein